MKILVAMSGGVDSTVAAYKLIREGHDVIGVNFSFLSNEGMAPRNIGEDNNFDEIKEKLGIEIISRDYSDEFKDIVIKPFVNDYENGITPNPCALCNGTMKFAKLIDVMNEVHADMIATGHYANVCRVPNTSRYAIKKSANMHKDQSYMLYRLNMEQLSHAIFPLGDIDKNEVRETARKLDLSVADKKDSQDVCFINAIKENGDSAYCSVGKEKSISYKEFIKRYRFGHDYKEKMASGNLSIESMRDLPCFKKGEFVDIDGNVLGFHDGIINYTIGQRKGINIAFGSRKFVVSIDAKKNQIVLGDNSDLLSSSFKLYDIVFSGCESTKNKVSYLVKTRYRHEGTMCEVDFSTYNDSIGDRSDTNFVICTLREPVRAITPGQAAVFYDSEGMIMFGGRIGK